MNRRTFLTVVTGGSIACSGLPVVTGKATSATDGKSAEQAGVADEVRNAFNNGNTEKALALLRNNGVEHSFDSVPFPISSQKSSGGISREGLITPNDAMDYYQSSLSIAKMWLRSDPQGNDIYYLAVWSHISDDTANWVDDANPKDAMCITWSDTYFQPVSQSSSNFTPTDDSYLMDYEDYKTYGVWAKVDDNQFQDNNPTGGTFTVGFSTELEKLQSGNKFNVNGEYLHNWNFGGAYWVNTFNLGPAGIDFGGYLTDFWQIEVTIKV